MIVLQSLITSQLYRHQILHIQQQFPPAKGWSQETRENLESQTLNPVTVPAIEKQTENTETMHVPMSAAADQDVCGCVDSILSCEMPKSDVYTCAQPTCAAFTIPADALEKLHSQKQKWLLDKGQ